MIFGSLNEFGTSFKLSSFSFLAFLGVKRKFYSLENLKWRRMVRL